MQLGFLTQQIDDIAKAGRLGFDAVELNVRGLGNPAEQAFDAERVQQVRRLCEQHDIAISALAYYDMAFQPPADTAVQRAYERVFDTADALGVQVITSMSGFDPNRDWNGNLQLFADRFGPVATLAEQRGVRVAFENWMGFSGHVPFKPRNMGGSPDTWDAWFCVVPSQALGIELDPSHLYWQGIDHLRALREYKDRVYHVHAKDTEMLPERRYRGGVNGDYFRFRIPGYGEINWAAFVSALDEIGYRGGIAIEHEDPIYSGERFDEGLVRGWQVLNPLIHPTAPPSPQASIG
jgi:sugar phosphate isomerase/epimerase